MSWKGVSTKPRGKFSLRRWHFGQSSVRRKWASLAKSGLRRVLLVDRKQCAEALRRTWTVSSLMSHTDEEWWCGTRCDECFVSQQRITEAWLHSTVSRWGARAGTIKEGWTRQGMHPQKGNDVKDKKAHQAVRGREAANWRKWERGSHTLSVRCSWWFRSKARAKEKKANAEPGESGGAREGLRLSSGFLGWCSTILNYLYMLYAKTCRQVYWVMCIDYILY